MSRLRITAVVPNFNHAKFLPRSVGALANQSVLPHEILVVDDASTDNSMQVLEELSQKYPMLRVARNEKNLGVNGTMNRGISLATGDYVLFPSADDEVRPGLFENVERMFCEYPQAGICSGLSEWRCQTTGMNWFHGTGMPNRHCYLTPAEMVDLGRRGVLTINGQNAVFKKSALIEAGSWLPQLHWFSDWFGQYVVGFRHGMCHVPEVLSNFYLYPRSYYNAKSKAYQERRAVMCEIVRLLEEERYADVAPLFRASGLLGAFGWPMLWIVAGNRTHRRFLTPQFLRLAARRSAEVVGRRFFPTWMAKWCLRVFYGRESKGFLARAT